MDNKAYFAKINPPKPWRLVSRARLLEELEACADYRLLLMSATAGFGKTSLLSDFVANTRHKICWYGLHEDDRDPAQFCSYLLQSVRVVYPEFGEQFEQLLDTIVGGRGIEKENNLARLAQVFANDLLQLSHGKSDLNETILVLDDYQFAESPLVGHFMRHLLLLLDAPFHVIISTRTIPEYLPTAFLMAQRLLRAIGPHELSFTRDEIATFLQNYYDVSDSKQTDSLLDYSEGWITAVVLAMASRESTLSRLQPGSGPFSNGQLDSRRIFEFLGDEVLAALSPETQDFLLRTSTLSIFSDNLCQLLTGRDDCEILLDQLVNQQLFIEPQAPPAEAATNKQYYKYHSLFRNFLQSRLARQPELWHITNCRAAELAVEMGDYQAAVQNYLTVAETNRAAEVIAELCPKLYDNGRTTTLSELLAQLRQKEIETLPVLAYYQGLVIADSGDIEPARELLGKAEKLFISKGAITEAARTMAMRGFWLARSGRLDEAKPLCQKAMALLAGFDDLDKIGRESLALTNMSMAFLSSESGQKELAEKYYKEAFDAYQKLGIRYRVASIELNMANLYSEMGRLIKSNIYYERSLKYFIGIGSQNLEVYTRFGMARNLLFKGAYTEALEQFILTLQLTDSLGNKYLKGFVLYNLGNLHRDTARFTKATSYYNEALEIARLTDRRLELETLSGLALNYLLNNQKIEARETVLQGVELNEDYHLPLYSATLEMVMGLYHYDARSYKRALVSFDKAAEVFGEHHWSAWLCRSKLYQALTYFGLNEFKKALSCLEESVELVSTIGFDPYLPCDLSWATKLFEYASRKKISDTLQEFLTRKGLLRVPLIEDMMQEADAAEALLEAEIIPQLRVLDESRNIETSPPKLMIVRPFDQKQEQLRAGKLAASGKYDLEVRTLDGGRVWNNEHEIEHWRMGKARELFFFLLEHGKCSRDELVEALWPDADFASTPNLFHFTMSSLRKVIKPADIKLASQRYSLVGEIWHDADELKRQVKLAQAAVQINMAELTAVLDLYQRDYLDQIYSDWATYRRQEILQTYLDGLSLLARHFESQNQFGQAGSLWRRYLVKDSYNEEAYRLLINCYLALGNKKEARQQYAECMRMLEEVDAKPTQQTQSLLQKLA